MQKFITPVTCEEIEHDPNGDRVQIHELPDGSGIMTLDAKFSAELGWKVGDDIEWTFADDGTVSIKKVKK